MVHPSSYSLIPLGRVTTIKNQGTCGSCWSFATYGSLESCLMPGEERDCSEQNMIDNSGFDLGPCDGGNTDMATAYLTGWFGPKDEWDDPYIFATFGSDMQATQKKVQQVIYLPNRSGSLDNDVIKDYVTAYGAVYISMCWDPGALY